MTTDLSTIVTTTPEPTPTLATRFARLLQETLKDATIQPLKDPEPSDWHWQWLIIGEEARAILTSYLNGGHSFDVFTDGQEWQMRDLLDEPSMWPFLRSLKGAPESWGEPTPREER